MTAPRQDEDWWRRRASLLTDLQRRTQRRVSAVRAVYRRSGWTRLGGDPAGASRRR